jgi:class 3 adenylate cyclase/tetratricopeptide (TPR) repeat protein
MRGIGFSFRVLSRGTGEGPERFGWVPGIERGDVPYTRHVPACSTCGTDNPDAARFCMACGASFEPAPTEERRVITVLFADLVGFTERSDAADPEDVRRTLIPFHTAAKAAIERFGGTLDKFIGDAAMGVFGAPVAHEDDPERAVRAALDLLATVATGSVRVAVNTGDAVVTAGRGPQVGEAVAGDVVNTASRMQAVAPPGGLVIGDEARRAVRDRFEVEALPAFRAKGKAAPIGIWRVIGEREERVAGPEPKRLVGRGRELALLRELFDRMVSERTGASVTVVAPPGVGKTRLLQELRRTLARVTWLEGACAPYGEDVTFRALADLVRAASGIRRGADVSSDRGRLRALVERAEPSAPERAWLLARLEPLLGVEPDTGAGDPPSIPAAETAAACARLLAHAASGAAAVIAIEDIHRAEPALLDAIRHMVESFASRPMLVVCTARPDVLDVLIGTEIRLSELSMEETRDLVDELAEAAPIGADIREAVIERSGGNPLFALEFVRMLEEAPSGAAKVPTSVRAVIGARLDAIPREHRAMLQDAAVIGSSFWPRALVALADGEDDEPTILGTLEEGVRRGLVSSSAPSLVPAEPQYGFTHALIREVAYERLPRRIRAAKHLRAGRWLEAAAGSLAGAPADLLAKHFASAAELASATGETDLEEAAREPAVRWLIAAGDLTARVDEAGAFALYDRARALAPERSEALAYTLARTGVLGRYSGMLPGVESLSRLQASLALERLGGDPRRIGDALVRLGVHLGAMGEAASARAAYDEAVSLLEPLPPGLELAKAFASRAEKEMFAGHLQDSLAWAERGLELGRALDSPEVMIVTLHVRGDGRCSAGDVGGLDDLREALDIATARGSASDIVISRTYVAEWLSLMNGPAAGLEVYEEAVTLAEHRGAFNQGTQAKVASLSALVELGRWDDALGRVDGLLGLGPDRVEPPLLVVLRSTRAGLLLARGERDVLDDPAELIGPARRTGEQQVLALASTVAARIALARGDRAAARAFVVEFEEATRGLVATYRATNATSAVRVCADLGDADLARRIGEFDVTTPLERLYADATHAMVFEMDGDTERAASRYANVQERWRVYGCVFEGAAAALGRGRCLRALGREAEAAAAFATARDGFQELGARPWVVRTDAASA